MIRVNRLAKRFGDTVLFTDLSFTVGDGEHIAISGASGKGKTTLLRILCGLERPDAGTVEGLDPREIAVQFQEPRLFDTQTALGNVTCVLSDPKRGAEEAEQLLRRLGMGEALHKYPPELSGGMKQRVSLARALIAGRPVVFADEPFTALDEELHRSVREVLKEYTAGKTLFLISHDPADAEALTDRTVTL